MIETEKELAKKAVKPKKAPVKSSNPKWAGRKTVVTPEVLSKLEEGFAMGFTDRECCLYASIAPATLYRYIEDNPQFWEQKELLKDQPKLNAKAVVTKKIREWDDYNSRWYLERKGKDEFSIKQEIEQSWDLNIHVDFKTMSDEELDKYIEDNN